MARPARAHGLGRTVEVPKYWSRAATMARSSSAVILGGSSYRIVRTSLERDVPVLPRWDLFPLRPEHPERLDQLGPGIRGFDHVVDEPTLGRDVGIRELLLVPRDQLCSLRLGVGGVLDLPAEDDVDRTLRAHHRDLRRRPREGHVGPEVLRVHDDVRAAVSLARDHGDPRDRGLGPGIQELGAAADDSPVLLRRAGEEARYVLEADQRDVERVAEPDEPGGLLAGVVVERA